MLVFYAKIFLVRLTVAYERLPQIFCYIRHAHIVTNLNFYKQGSNVESSYSQVVPSGKRNRYSGVERIKKSVSYTKLILLIRFFG